MSLQDPLADMFTRIRNAQSRAKPSVDMPSSKLKVAVAKILLEEGYVRGYNEDDGAIKTLTIELKYFQGRPVIDMIKRFSRPGVRRYRSKRNLPLVIGGFGVAVLSTSRGVMSDKQARAQGIGGEVLCVVS